MLLKNVKKEIADLVDMRRLHFNDNGPESVLAETFFYVLDVGTSNALVGVLYNESMKIRLSLTGPLTPMMNIVQLKMQLVEDLVGTSINNLFERGAESAEREQHNPPPPVHIGLGSEVRPR